MDEAVADDTTATRGSTLFALLIMADLALCG